MKKMKDLLITSSIFFGLTYASLFLYIFYKAFFNPNLVKPFIAIVQISLLQQNWVDINFFGEANVEFWLFTITFCIQIIGFIFYMIEKQKEVK